MCVAVCVAMCCNVLQCVAERVTMPMQYVEECVAECGAVFTEFHSFTLVGSLSSPNSFIYVYAHTRTLCHRKTHKRANTQIHTNTHTHTRTHTRYNKIARRFTRIRCPNTWVSGRLWSIGHVEDMPTCVERFRLIKDGHLPSERGKETWTIIWYKHACIRQRTRQLSLAVRTS